MTNITTTGWSDASPIRPGDTYTFSDVRQVPRFWQRHPRVWEWIRRHMPECTQWFSRNEPLQVFCAQ